MSERTLLYDAAGEPLVTSRDRPTALLIELWGLLVSAIDEDLQLETMDCPSAAKAIEAVVGPQALQARWHAEIVRARARAQQEREDDARGEAIFNDGGDE